MAGGIGSRFWPQSRTAFPKQFLDILNTGRTLIQMTYDRFSSFCAPENILVVTNEEYVSIVKEQLPELSLAQILSEPTRRNTAPCVAYASYKIRQKNPKANILIAPSDHLVLKPEAFKDVAEKAFDFVAQNMDLVTLGIKPTRPDTGYGYIQFVEDDNLFCKKVKTFTEKPTLEIAKTFIKSGDFLWNAGIFVWNVQAICAAFKKYLPEISEVFENGKQNFYTPSEQDFIEAAYAQCTNISIDYGVLEKADNVRVIPADFGWSDVGTWASLYDVFEKDYLGNAVHGKRVKIYGASNNMILAPKNKLVVVEGLEDFCVIDTADVLMIIRKNKEQEVKNITTDLRRDKLEKYL